MNDLSLPSVSVILPILNEERDLSNCISAILKQEYSGNIEIILALGPSKDRTTEIASELAKLDSRIKIVNNPSGQTATGLNLAIAKSIYEVILPLIMSRLPIHITIVIDPAIAAIARAKNKDLNLSLLLECLT